MANWNLPTIQSNYLDFVTEMNDKFRDAGTLFGFASSNQPVGSFRFNRGTNIFEEYVGDLVWVPKVLGIAGGGTGSNNANDIRVNLGLGSMSTQNSNAVNITGGSITGVAFNANDITGGIISLARGGTGASLATGPNGWVLLSNGVNTHWAPGTNISNLNASNITSGVISPSVLPGNIAYVDKVSQSFSGRQHFVGEFLTMGPVGIYSNTVYTANPAINWLDSAYGNGAWRIQASGGNLYVQFIDDGYSTAYTAMKLRRDAFVEMDGRLVSQINAYNITHGYINPAVLAPGPSSSTFLRGDNVWAVPSTGGGAPIPFPSGMISMFANGCPAGWTRVAQFDNRFPMGANSYGQQGGGSRHSHSFSVNSTGAGGHSHSFYSGVGGRARGNVSGTTSLDDNSLVPVDHGGNFNVAQRHAHSFSVNADLAIEDASASGQTSHEGDHSHQVYGETSDADFYPPWTAVFFCQKD